MAHAYSFDRAALAVTVDSLKDRKVLLVGDVLTDPSVKFQLKVGTFLPRPQLLALQDFQVMRQPVDDHHVRQLSAELVVQLGLFAFCTDAEVLGFLH